MIVFADAAKLYQRQTTDAPTRCLGTWIRIAEDPKTSPAIRQMAYHTLDRLLAALQ